MTWVTKIIARLRKKARRKATGAQGNVIGWVPLGDLKNAVQELVQREQAAQQQMPAAPAATPEPEASPKKKN